MRLGTCGSDIFAWRVDSDRLEALLSKPLVSIRASASLRDAANLMLNEGVGRLPVIEDGELRGIVTRSDLLEGHRHRISASDRIERTRRIRLSRRRAVRSV